MKTTDSLFCPKTPINEKERKVKLLLVLEILLSRFDALNVQNTIS